MLSPMAKIIPVSFRRSRLPRTLLRDGWWLESQPSHPTVIAFPKHTASNPPSSAKSQTKPKTKLTTSHLTLVHSGK
jgi:hypothetical protein